MTAGDDAHRDAFVGHAGVVTSLGQECDIMTQSCPLHLTIETPRAVFRRGAERYRMFPGDDG